MEELMTTEEVAKFLRVSAKTVVEWAQKGELASAEIGGELRFQRADIKAWVKSKMFRYPKKDVSSLKFKTLITADRIVILDKISKKELFDKMINILSETPFVKNSSELYTAIYEREDLMSTGIGLNLGIPHVRLKTVKDMAVAIALVRDGIENYESLDSEPVKLVFMIIARDDQHAQHLKFLSQLSTVLKDDDFRSALLNCTDAESIYKLLCGGEC
ncbi:MAG: PTS sugar transporter subunit IIA [Lentisphaeria bacterium]|nr:PTS sugar transporter subunit IIA [Lentisphaeria bacterium]